VAANSFLATKISYINAMAEICEATGADVHDLAEALAYDDRIGGKFLKPGLGFGGGCLPKDIRAFTHRAGELGVGQAVGLPPRGRRDQPAPPRPHRRPGLRTGRR
jgi:UDPglucose 6-dehydrogenase